MVRRNISSPRLLEVLVFISKEITSYAIGGVPQYGEWPPMFLG